MDIKIILFSGLAFNMALVSLIIYYVRRSNIRQANMASTRRQQMLEQGKIITTQENLLKSKQELLNAKEALLKEYRKMDE